MSDEELRAQMLSEAEKAIDKVLADRPAADKITLRDIERLAVRAGAEVGAEGAHFNILRASSGLRPASIKRAVQDRSANNDHVFSTRARPAHAGCTVKYSCKERSDALCSYI